MRREGFEFEIGPPKVILQEINSQMCEPYEEAFVEVPENCVGAAVELFAQRKGVCEVQLCLCVMAQA